MCRAKCEKSSSAALPASQWAIARTYSSGYYLASTAALLRSLARLLQAIALEEATPRLGSDEDVGRIEHFKLLIVKKADAPCL